MFQIYPKFTVPLTIPNTGAGHLPATALVHEALIFQGIHVVSKASDLVSGKQFFVDLPTGQSNLTPFYMDCANGQVFDKLSGTRVTQYNSHSAALTLLAKPDLKEITLNVEVINKKQEVIVLNTLDSCYGHAYLFLLNIQHIFKHKPADIGLVVLIQPMFRWLIPAEWVDEIWTAKMSLDAQRTYYPSLSAKINAEFPRFDKVHLSHAHLLPTAEKIEIERFVKVKPFSFAQPPAQPRITYVWREDFGRLWIKNVLVYGACKVLRIRPILRYLHWFRVVIFFYCMRFKFGNKYKYTAAGDGKFGFFPSFVEDARTTTYGDEIEVKLAHIYAQSAVVIGTHGSSMLIPSSLAGSVICLMPYMKWEHIGEDIVYTTDDARIATLATRYIPTGTAMIDLTKIVTDLLGTYQYNLDKFTYDKTVL
jgi:hypothetical protein